MIINDLCLPGAHDLPEETEIILKENGERELPFVDCLLYARF